MTDTMTAERTTDVGGIAADRLRAFIDRIEKLEEEKKGISDDIKDVYMEAKSTGFETPIIRAIVKLRKKDRAERQEEEHLLELYKLAVGLD